MRRDLHHPCRDHVGQRCSSSNDDGPDDEGSTDDDSDNNDDGGDGTDDDGSEVPDDGDSGEATAWVDADAAGGLGSAGADFGGLTRGDFLAGAGGSVVDIRLTNTGRPDVTVGTPDLSVPPVAPSQPGDEAPQDDGSDVLGFRELDAGRVPGAFVTDIRPDLVERLPTLDPSQLHPDVNPQANTGLVGLAVVGDGGDQGPPTGGGEIITWEVDAPLQFDAANIAVSASSDFATLDGSDSLDDQGVFAGLDLDDVGPSGSGMTGFDGDGPDGDDGMLGGPDGGPLP